MKKLIPVLLFLLIIYSKELFSQGNTPCQATQLTVGATCSFSTFNNSTFTDSNIPAPPCGDYDLGNTEDVWFYFVVPAKGNVTIEGGEPSGGLSDICFAVYSGNVCSNITLLVCDDDLISTVETMPKISLFNRTPGEVLWLRVWDFEGNNTGDFNVCVTSSTSYELDSAVTSSTIPLCTGILFDSGGASANYDDDEDYSVVIAPPLATSIDITIQSIAFGDADDVLYIYPGSNTSYTPIVYNSANDDSEPYNHHFTNDSILIRILTDNNSPGAGFEINWQGNIQANTYVSQQISCNSGSNGALIAVGSGTSPYTYLWGGGQVTQSISGLSANSYAVTITDNKGCKGTSTLALTQPTSISVTTIKTDASCNGYSDGDVTAIPSGGTPPYTYSWNSAPVQTTATATGLPAGTYTVTVTDANSCTVAKSQALTQPVALTISMSKTNATCFGGNNGTATATPAGGTYPYSYIWDNIPPSATATATGLTANSYAVTVTDNNGCTANNSITVDQPLSNLTVTTTKVDVLCKDNATGSATATGSGGTGPYTYQWDAAAGNQVAQTATGLTDGTYTVTVTDANSCTASTTVTINEPAAVLSANVTVNNNVNCFGMSTGSATVTPAGGTGGYSYSWPNGGSAATNATLNAGAHLVTVTDGNSCSIIKTVTITQNPQITATASVVDNVDCFGESTGSATVAYAGGNSSYTIDWLPNGFTNDGTATYSDLPAGLYSVSVTDGLSCQAVSSVTITQNTQIIANISASTNVLCYGGNTGSATVTASGGSGALNYLWNDPAPAQTTVTATLLTAGTYSVTVADVLGCSTSASVIITQPSSALTADAVVVDNISCNGLSDGVATVTGSGGTGAYSYNWSPNGYTGNGTNTYSDLAPNNYTVTLTDANGCTASDNVLVFQYPVVTASATVVNNVSCNGGSNGVATASGSGGTSTYTYLWSDSAPAQTSATADNLLATTYTVTVYDGNGCPATANVTITEPSAVTAGISAFTNVTCNGGNDGSLTVTAGGGTGTYNYIWNNSATSATINGLTAGTYSVSVYDSFGCSAYTSRTIFENSAVTATASVVSNALCFGSSDGVATVIPNGGTGIYTYSWPGGATTATASGFSAGSYTVSVYDSNGCSATSSTTISQPAAVTVSTSTTLTTCNGGNDGTIIVTASNGTAPYDYSLNGTDWQSNSTLNGLSAGTYSVTVSDDHGCTGSASGIIVTEPGPIAVSIISLNDIFQVGGLPEPLSTHGSPLGGSFYGPGVIGYTQEFDPAIAGVGGPYEIIYIYTDTDGCTNSDTFEITVVSSGASISNILSYYCYYDPTVVLQGIPDIHPFTVDYDFTGPGIVKTSNNQATFTPALAGPGNSIIHYSYIDPDNGQEFYKNYTVFIDSVGEVNFITLEPNYCEDDAMFYNLNAVNLYPSGGTGSWSISPATGSFSGSGNSATFNPDLATPGIYSITYTYTTAYGCFDDTVKTTEVTTLPVVDFTIREIYNRVEPPAVLTGSPPGGMFSGTGIIGNEFRPDVATIGTNYINYTYTDPVTGCSDYVSKPTIVQVATGSIDGANPFNQYCWDGLADTLIGNPVNTNGAPGVFSMTGAGITPLGPDSIAFDPQVAGPGNHTITYTYTGADSVVQFELYVTVNVDYINPVSFIGLDTSYCVTDDDVVLTGVPPESGSGLFYGVPASALFSAGHSAIFKPSQLAPGTYNITYEFTASTGCKRDTIKQVTIYPLPLLSFDLRTTYSSVEPPYELHGVPSGGSFTGSGIIGNYFYPNIAGLGTHQVIYTYTNENSCQNTDTMYTEVIEAQGDILGVDAGNQYCFNGLTDTLVGIAYNSDGTPGIFEGDGLTPIGIDSVVFDPATVTPGYHDIVFRFNDPSGTELSITTTIHVDYINPVNIIGLNSQYCVNNPAEELLGYPSNGVFSGDGMIGNYFTPSIVTTLNTSVNYTVTSLAGCTRDTTIYLDVYDIPVVSFSVDSQFCSNSDPVEIIGLPANGYFSGPNLSGTDTVIFTPNSSVVGTHEISYTYTDPSTSCSNTLVDIISVDLVENLSISAIESGYCVNSDSVLLTGLVGGTADGVGGFYGTGVYDSDINDGEAYFHPGIADVGGPYNIQYTNTDANGCVNNYFTDIFVYDLPNVSIINLADGYCKDATDQIISGFPENANGSFYYTGGPGLFDEGDGTATFYPSDASPVDTVFYTYEDANHCVNSTWQIVRIYNLPNANFEIGDACIIDSISFTDLSTSDDIIETWYWNFGDIGSPENISLLQNPSHFYFTEGDKIVTLTVTTESGCVHSHFIEITLGSKPFVDFEWTNECFDPASPTATQFVNLSSDTSNVSWNFGDSYISNEVNPAHTYSEAITYSVTLIVETPNQCVDTLTQDVSIRPYVTSFPYSQDFEAGNGGWVDDASEPISSWEFGEPMKTTIVGAASGTHSWCTNLIDNYENNEKSAIIGPCFNFTNLKRPMIIMKKWSSTQNGSDGAVLQARIDGVTDWENIGSMDDGINWYNGVGIIGNPGGIQNVGSYGWTGNDTGWVEVRHNLDQLVGYDNVRFRIAFGSDGNATSDGFAFDDIWIGERSRMVLVEHFTNSSDENCADINPQVNTIVNGYLGDVIDVQYHTSFPGFDQMNEDNPSAPSARSMYYGASSVPWSVVDGTVYNGFSTGFVENPQIVELRALEDPLFTIELNTEKSTIGVDVNVTITSQEAITDKNISCQLVVVEKVINSLTGTNGETMFRSVLKKMLPNAGGTNFSHNWWDGQSETISATWTYSNVYDPDQVYVVAFVQDEITKEIYQAISDDTTIVFTDIENPVISGEQNFFSIYPNPASDVVNILFSEESNNLRTLEIYDNLGQLVETIKVNSGTRYIRKNTEKYAEGIYMIVLKEQFKVIETNKLIIAY